MSEFELSRQPKKVVEERKRCIRCKNDQIGCALESDAVMRIKLLRTLRRVADISWKIWLSLGTEILKNTMKNNFVFFIAGLAKITTKLFVHPYFFHVS